MIWFGVRKIAWLGPTGAGFHPCEEQNPMHLSLIQRAVIVALCGFAAWSITTTAQAQQVQTVFVISMENHNLTQPVPLSNPQQIKGNVAAPFLNSLMTPGNANAVQTSFATNYQNVGPGIHPSAPNYIWSQGGSNFGVLNDNDPFGSGGSAQTTSQNLSNVLQTAGIAWKAYEEDTDISHTNNTALPNIQWTVPLQGVSGTFASGTNAYNGSNQYNYDVNHDPMVYFTDTNGGNNSTPTNPLAKNYAPLQQLQTDLTNNTVAQYNWITPDLYNTSHSALSGGYTYHGTHYTGDQAAVAQGDHFLSMIVPQIEASAAYQNNGVIIIWFDETEGGDTAAYTLAEIIISPLAKGNAFSSNLLYTHSSDLITTEEIFGVGPCIRGGCTANDLSLLFQPGAIGSGPTLTSISPSTGSQGSSVPVTLTGTGFVVPLTVNLSGSGIMVSERLGNYGGGHKQQCCLQCHRCGGRPHADLRQPVNRIAGFLRSSHAYGNWFRSSPDRQCRRIWHYGIERLRCQQHAGHGDLGNCRIRRRRSTQHLRYHRQWDQRYDAVHRERGWRPADADRSRAFEWSAWNLGQRNSHRDEFHPRVAGQAARERALPDQYRGREFHANHRYL
jgi:hypothetical protein